MMGIGILLVLLVGVIVVAFTIGARRSTGKGGDEGDGADIVPYLVLALAMGVAGFALAELASTAFPGESLVFDPNENLATSLSALVVSVPFVIYFWRRQTQRRMDHPGSPGWTLYLSIIELVFTTAFAISAIMFLNGLFTEDPASAWTRTLVFGAIVVFHELAARATPPLSDAGELRRVIGSAIGLLAVAIGLTGVVFALITWIDPILDPPLDAEFHPFLAMLVVGAPIWWYRWFRPWDGSPTPPRLTWAVIVAVASLTVAVGAATGIAVLIAQFLLSSDLSAEHHFEPLRILLSLVIAGTPIWLLHRRFLGQVGGSSLAAYRYAMAALGLATSVSMAIALTTAVFDSTLIVGGSRREIAAFAVILVVGLVVWLVFERRATRATEPVARWPRRLFTLGVGIATGLVAAGALITTLFILIRRLLEGTSEDSVLEPVTVLVYSGLATWYLLNAYFREREVAPDGESVVPFQVTVICSHPGMIATKFPDHATLRVLHRGDEAGVVDETMADGIVEAVGGRSSYVWVDENGFRVAPMRST